MPENVDCRVCRCRFRSRGVLPRVWNALEAVSHQGEVNHVTGDVHYLTLFFRKRRTLLTIHDCGTLERLTGWRKRLYSLLWFQLPMARSAAVTTISRATRDDLLRRFPVSPDKIRVIPDCIPDSYAFAPKPFKVEEPRILQVGTRTNKNLDRVARALNGVACHLDIVGRLSSEQKRILKQNRIDFTNGYDLTDDAMLRRYRQCDMLVFASLNEGFGMPIIEAQAMGRPVVTSDVPPMPETGGDGACYVDPLDVGSIRNGILRVIDDAAYRRELIRKGRENAQRFRPETVAARYADLYREVMARA